MVQKHHFGNSQESGIVPVGAETMDMGPAISNPRRDVMTDLSRSVQVPSRCCPGAA
eukprot:CAMPEP_0198125964 /NCGR_PEP_ID=MMETSP1442-20131203/43720_1 /TAXON_ID= /ORGANISM="Craspedostauros australis, Strain CCMP3328" /LENGTH=55 /DNA_ID=CAMNT_0043785657 /DNA_START=56 /DNA_END=219 /DNA_ORIENTATION=-